LGRSDTFSKKVHLKKGVSTSEKDSIGRQRTAQKEYGDLLPEKTRSPVRGEKGKHQYLQGGADRTLKKKKTKRGTF